MKFRIIFALLLAVPSLCYGQLFEEWLKTGSEKQPRYFLKNYPMPLCGSLEKVTAKIVKGHPLNSKFPINYADELPSCLEAQDSMDGQPYARYEILEKRGADFYIRQIPREENQVFPVLSVPANSIVTLWAMRYPQGEIMFDGPSLCDHMHNWRSSERNLNLGTWLRSKSILPFPTKAAGQTVRYHVFEYHLGCGT